MVTQSGFRRCSDICVTVRCYIKLYDGSEVAAVSTRDGNVYYVDTKMIEVMEVNE